MTSRSHLTCLVPTAGLSPHLPDCLEALRSAADAEIVVAAEDDLDAALVESMGAARVVRIPVRAGFATACNRALQEVRTEFVALVNDDVLVEPGWDRELVWALENDPRCAAAQGTILQLADPTKVDGCGIAWNESWQAVQIDHGAPASQGRSAREVFGVSGTASVFRRQALAAAALGPGRIFDPVLDTYYEDVELACRLRAKGFHALHVPAARARHAGGVSSSTRPAWRYRRIYGNRLLVLARLWGSTFYLRLPRLLYRDLRDGARACLDLKGNLAAGILGGWSRAAFHLPEFAHRGQPLVQMPILRRFQIIEPQETGLP